MPLWVNMFSSRLFDHIGKKLQHGWCGSCRPLVFCFWKASTSVRCAHKIANNSFSFHGIATDAGQTGRASWVSSGGLLWNSSNGGEGGGGGEREGGSGEGRGAGPPRVGPQGWATYGCGAKFRVSISSSRHFSFFHLFSRKQKHFPKPAP